MENKFVLSLLTLAAAGTILVGSAFAQAPATPASTSAATPPAATAPAPKAGPGAVDPGHPRVNQVNARETRQQQRIANGVKNDKLTPQQTSNIEQREANVEKSEKKDMATDNGHLTKGEQKNLNQRQNKISKTIKNDKDSK